MPLTPKRLSTTDAEFSAQLRALTAWDTVSDRAHEARVADIIAAVRAEGDAALLRFTRDFDRYPVASGAELVLSMDTLKGAYEGLAAPEREALNAARDRIWSFHEAQIESSWRFPDQGDGVVLGQEVRPMARVGLYVPGGKAAYPSSVLMNAIPAKVAGVGMLQMVVPAPDGVLNPLVLAAAYVGGVDRVITIGGAQAVAALAYGTETVLPVDKIVGPGNAWVATAKRQVFGKVGIDMIAGPSEILVYVEPPMDPHWVAMDLFSQAEHDEAAQPILVCSDPQFMDAVLDAMDALLPTLERREIIEASINHRCALIRTVSREDAISVINTVAPEHLELAVDDPEALLPLIQHAGAIFMGRYTPEALGDYCAGPNHVLPTSGTARFASPLGVYDFVKRSSVIHCAPDGSARLARIASVLARGEGLTAHARSAEYRQ
ncbi:MAG: histidinol dehydrogenase [Litorivicinaceae bacterium]